ncbi:MAG TPA: stage III sporulation protein AF, partial [Clostridia bacterium]
LVDLVMTEGSTKKYIKSIMSIITLFIILSPIPALLNKNFDFSNIFDGNEIQADTRIIQNVSSQQISILEESLEKKLNSDGYKNANVRLIAAIENNVLKIKAVSIDIFKCEIKKESSTYEKIKQKIREYLNDNNITVIVYG